MDNVPRRKDCTLLRICWLFVLLCFCFVSTAQQKTTRKGEAGFTFGAGRPLMSRDSCRDLIGFDSVQNLLKSLLSPYISFVDSNMVRWTKKTDTLLFEVVDENLPFQEFEIGDVYLDQQQNLLKVESWSRQYHCNVTNYYLNNKLIAVSMFRDHSTLTWYYPLTFDVSQFDPENENQNCILWGYYKLGLRGENFKDP